MRRALLSGLMLVFALGNKPKLLWQANVDARFGIQGVMSGNVPYWARQQGVLFAGPDRLIVYQVKRRAQLQLSPGRNLAGGGGNFFLDIRVLAAADGAELHQLLLATNSEMSQIMALSGGRLLIRTGDLLSVYSDELKPVAGRKLAFDHQTEDERWDCKATPDGDQIILIHQHESAPAERLFDGRVISEGKSSAEVEIIDSSTLKSVAAFKLPRVLRSWSAGEGFLVTADPGQPFGSRSGRLSYDGIWSEFLPEGRRTDKSCLGQGFGLPGGMVAVDSCDGTTLVGRDGLKALTLAASEDEHVDSVRGSGVYAAVEFARNRRDARMPATPVKVDVFDLKSGDQMLSADISDSGPILYAVSERGMLAVLQGNELSLYATDSQ